MLFTSIDICIKRLRRFLLQINEINTITLFTFIVDYRFSMDEREQEAPLAERMRPRELGDFVGQDHLVGTHGALIQMIRSKVLPSMIFWGPPGVGKTTLAQIIAEAFERDFYRLNAISSGVKDIREIIERAERSEE